MAEPDYNGKGFQQGKDGNGVYGDAGSDAGSASDYDTWDWKQIMAAVNGMAADTVTDDHTALAKSLADPQSLQDAANAFFQVQQTFSGVAKALGDQVKALAGEDGPWKGPAADAFHDAVSTFAKQVQANADVLSGGSTGTNSIPNQLADNAVNLLNAQTKISQIDNWYANQAVLMGVEPMANGLIPVSQKPEIVEMMTHDMRAVLKSLASDYQVTIDNIASPKPVTSPGGDPKTGGGGDDGGADLKKLGLGDGGDGGGADLKKLALGGGGDGGGADLKGLPFPGGTDTGGSGGKGLGGGPGLGLSDPTPFDGGLDTGGAGGLGDVGELNSGAGLDPSALDSLLNPNTGAPTQFPGSTGLDGTGAGAGSGFTVPPFIPSAFTGGTSTSGTGKPFSSSNALGSPGQFGDALSAADFPGSLGTGGSAHSFPGLDTDALETPAGLADGALTESALPSGLASGSGSGEGMPFMPGMGGMGGGMGAAASPGASERSDASGLLDPSAEPWAGGTGLGDGDVGSEFGTAPGGEGLDLPGAGGLAESGAGAGAGAEGMPFMPGMGGMGGGMGAAAQPGAGERSEASGLLDPSVEPWSGDEELAAGDVGSILGAAPGGEGLDLPGAGGLGEEFAGGLAESGAGAGAEGMPFMPGMGGMGGGMGAAAQPGAGERSEASGLLDPSVEPWSGDEDLAAEEVGSDGGTLPGSQSLDLASAQQAATVPTPMALDSDGNPVPVVGVEEIASEATTAPSAAVSPEPWTSGPDEQQEEGAGSVTASTEGAVSTLATAVPAFTASSVSTPESAAASATAPPAFTAPSAPAPEPASQAGQEAASDQELTAMAGMTAAAVAMVSAPGISPSAHAGPVSAATAPHGGAPSGAVSSAGKVPGAAATTGAAKDPSGTSTATHDPERTSDLGDSQAESGDGHHVGHRPEGIVLVAGLPLAGTARDEEKREGGHAGDGDAQGGPGATGTAGGRSRNGGGDGDGPEGPGGGPDDPDEDADVPLAAPVASAPPDDRVAVLREHGEESLDDVAAWDAAGEEFAPLLWPTANDDEAEGTSSGHSDARPRSEKPSGAAVAGTRDQADEEPQRATWRPSRAAILAGPVTVAPVYRSSGAAWQPEDLSTEMGTLSPGDAEETDGDTEEDKSKSRGIADLLVQDGNTWGALPEGREEIG